MPTYDYECRGCGHRFELFQSITAPPVRKCPACAAMKVKRLIGSGGAILFRGSGFYTTDYRSPEYRKKASAEDSPGGPKAESTDKKPSNGEKTD